MRKVLMLMVAALALTGWSFAQDQDNAAKPQDQDNAAKQDMKKAGKDTKDAAKATGVTPEAATMRMFTPKKEENPNED